MWRGRSASLATLLALYATALVLFALANGFPLFTLTLHGSVAVCKNGQGGRELLLPAHGIPRSN